MFPGDLWQGALQFSSFFFCGGGDLNVKNTGLAQVYIYSFTDFSKIGHNGPTSKNE